jgi:hypothetical protein
MNGAFIASVTGMITALNADGSAWRMTIEHRVTAFLTSQGKCNDEAP